ncbi:MAG TPA: hypothetical protein VNP97_01180, partial [Microbacterium sp.]|nr:hypothetical protein [Microbacterium sp.]
MGAPAGRVPDIAGPEVFDVPRLVEIFRETTGARPRRGRLPIRLPGAVGRAYRAGENLAADGAQRGIRTWREFLIEREREAVAARS